MTRPHEHRALMGSFCLTCGYGAFGKTFNQHECSEFLALTEEERAVNKAAYYAELKRRVAAMDARADKCPTCIAARKATAEKRDHAVDEVLAENPSHVARYRQYGTAPLIGYFVGQVMKRLDGKADAALVQKALRERLEQPPSAEDYA